MNRLIFNKNNDGIAEMQRYFSQISGALEFSNLLPDVEVAQEELEKYVGADIIAKAVDHYHSAEFESAESGAESGSGDEGETLEDLDGLVYKVQAAVALMGYRDFAQNNDATHTRTGRTARSDKDTDTLNLRLIEQDDQALLRKGYKAIDRLIKYIDLKKFTEWTGSAIYKQTRELFIWNADLFDRYFPIEQSVRVFLMMGSMQRKVQLDRIFTRLGEEQYAALLDKVQKNALTEAADQVLYDLVCFPIAELAMSEALLKLPVQLFPESIIQKFWGPGNGASALVLREKMVKDLEEAGIKSLKRLEAELERRAAAAAAEPITDDTIVDIVDRMDGANLYARV